MSDQNLRLVATGPLPVVPHLPLGRYLVDSGVITGEHLVQALQMQARLGAPIGEILIAEGWADSSDIMAALSQQSDLPLADLAQHPRDLQLAGLRPAAFWLKHRVIPWRRQDGTLLIATSRPDQFWLVRAGLDRDCPDVLPVLVSEAAILLVITRLFARSLAEAAQIRVPARFSCRTWGKRRPVHLAAAALVLLGAGLTAPIRAIGLLSVVAVITLCLFFALKLIGFVAHQLSHSHLTAPRPCDNADSGPARLPPARLPKVSVLVPLFRETEITEALIKRLAKLSYPKVLLDVVLVLEEQDSLTRAALDQTSLPNWIRVIEVPAHGGLTTKPRAMNYALDFCKGDIIGVWDAEDAPAPDQIEQVVARFARAPSDVVCLQGILD